VVPAVGRAWRLEVSRYQGGWLWVVLVLLAVAALGAIAAIVASGGGASSVRTIVATESTPATTAPTQTVQEPTSGAKTAPAPTETGARPSRQTGPVTWPQGRSGHTVVVGSVPVTRGREAALRQARAAIRAGLPGVGVLDSSQFASLRPGYYVIFSGFYRTVDGAQAAVETAQKNGYRRAYEREVTP
jgi:eukaryotic-like serine/threonine-protein kinase